MKHYKRPELYTDLEKNTVTIDRILQLVEKFIFNKQLEKTWVPGKDLVQYAGNYFDEKEYVAAVKTLLNGWLVLGQEGIRFESRFPKRLGKKLGILTNSGSSANLLMLAALTSKRGFNLPKGTKVLTPIAGFPTTINPIFQLGFEPIFVDIELNSLNLDLDQVEQKLKEDPEIRVITFAHVLGNPPDMDRLMELVEKYNLIFLEDCCDALGSTYKGRELGSFGKMASCSFYPAHHITMGEGGFVACNDLETERILRSFRDWGRGCYCVGKQNQLECGMCNQRFNNWLPALPDDVFDHKYVYEEIGYNLKPIEMQAAMAFIQMQKLQEIGQIRRKNHAAIVDIFKPYEQYFYLPTATAGSDPDWFAVALTIKDDAKFTRADFCQYLESHKIQTRPYFAGNIMLQPAYKDMMPVDQIINDFPVARKVTTDTFFLGCSPVITDEQIEYIKTIVNKFFNQSTFKS
jgi:CDP-4-dehydro-6-deoxyglucose reductase, E1